MQRILVNSLEGPALEWVVAALLDYKALTYHKETRSVTSRHPNGLVQTHDYTTNWNLTGPLLHACRINTHYCQDLRASGSSGLYIHCEAFAGDKSTAGYWRGSHARPLTAGLRCLVRLRNHGDEYAEVPDGIPSSA